MIKSYTAAVAVNLMLCQPAHAQVPDPESKSCSRNMDCISLMKVAQRYKQVGQPEEALKIYQKAYVEFDDPRLLVFGGKMQQELGRYEAAVHSYQAYLRSGVDEPQSKMAMSAQLWLREAEAAAAKKRSPPPSLQAEPVPYMRPVAECVGDCTPQPIVPAASSVREPTHPALTKSQGRSRVRLGLGATFATLSVLSLGAGLVLTTLDGRNVGNTCASNGGLRTGCQSSLLPLFAVSYSLSAGFVIGAGLAFGLPSTDSRGRGAGGR